MKNIIKYTSSMNLLFVEDNNEAREATLYILEEFFENIIVATDGEDGYQKFKDNQIDLIITDINMPKLNGFKMIEKIKLINQNVPVLILSAHNESNFFMESIKLGVDGYLLKPIILEQFINVLEKSISKIRLQNELKENLNLLHQYQEATDVSSIISKTDIYGNITYVNDEFCEISGYTREELIGNKHNMVRHPLTPASVFKDMWEKIKSKNMWQGIIKNKRKDGTSYYVKSTIKPILNQKGEIIEFISLRSDITNIMNPKNQLDDLIESTKESILILIKIERYDDIEKFYGIKLAEKIQYEFSKNILSFMSKEYKFEKVFILGNGEYALARDKKDCLSVMDEIVKSIKKFQQLVNDSDVDIDGINYNISIIISFSYGENTLENAKHGLRKLLENKQDFIVANNLIDIEYKKAQKNLETLKVIKRAIDDIKIISYFQPIINNKTQEVEKYESLVRLVDTDEKVMSPYFFLDVAKKAKYYAQITMIVLENSFNALDYTDKDISINISVLDIEKRSSRDKIFSLLDKYSKDAHRIVFELLEDENVRDFELIKSFIEEVKQKGVQIAIDDFGAGYSNFERLLDFQPDILKIDGSIVKNIETDTYSLSVVETIVTFAKKQNIKIVAEYVENEKIFNILRDLGVDYSQGYYFGKPEPLV